MNELEVKNGIIIDGVLHEATYNSDASCEDCSLAELCYNDDISDAFCSGTFDCGIFINRGKLIRKEQIYGNCKKR